MIEFVPEFDKIRPFFDNEVPDALNRLTKERGFLKTAGYFFPDLPLKSLVEIIKSIDSVKNFQANFAEKLVQRIIKQSTSALTFDGLEYIEAGKSYLFISNHRDIVLDSAILNHILFRNGFETTEIAIGSNLLILPWITDIVKLNKSFIVQRNIPAKELYEYSQLLSKYIRYTITEKNNSIWIAQREGRTKNGDDKTQISLLKMLNISGESNDLTENFQKLNIIPVSISYQYEPLDKEKVIELYQKQNDSAFRKTKVDDLLSMGKGMTTFKGHVHFNFAKPLDLQDINMTKNRNEQFDILAKLIDKHIYAGYKLHPVNYVAADLLNNSGKYSEFYNDNQKQESLEYFDKRLASIDGESDILRKMFLTIYANPVFNKYNN